MKEVTTVGIDIAKSVFQVHGINAVGDVVIRRKIRRSEVIEFFQDCLLAGSELRPVRPATIGLERL